MLLKILLPFLLLLARVRSERENPCPDPGIFPNLHDRSSYLVCSEVDNYATLTKIVNCPANYTFSETEKTCVLNPESPHHRVSRAISSDICKSPGPVCASCDVLTVCVNMENKLISYDNVSCSETSPENICDAKSRSCKPPDATSTCKASSASSPFRCLQPGYFPDPADCRKYHICDDSLTHFEDSCEGKYDPVNDSCQEDKACTNDGLSTPCSASNLMSKAISAYPNYYTVCIPNVVSSRGERKLIYQTAILQCPNNKQFNAETYSCELFCKNRPDRIADPEDCHYYYECLKPADATAAAPAPVRKACATSLAFDNVKKMCAPENRVPSCAKPHIITTREINETQMPAPNTTVPTVFNTSKTTSSTVQISTAKPQSNTTTVKPTDVPNRCREGEVTADRSYCRFYYKCIDGQLSRKRCTFFTRFNPSIGQCIFSFPFFPFFC